MLSSSSTYQPVIVGVYEVIKPTLKILEYYISNIFKLCTTYDHFVNTSCEKVTNLSSFRLENQW